MAFVYWVHLTEHTDLTISGYVGVTAGTVTGRFDKHCKLAAQGSDTHFHRALRKHGVENFIVDTLLEGDTDYCFLMEGLLRPRPNVGLNMAVGGLISPMIGRGHSDETKQKISEKSKLNRHTPETKAKIGNAHRGKTVSKESKKLISESRTGMKLSREHCAAIAKGRMGIRNSPESIAKSAAGLRGKPKTKEHCEAMSLARKGIKLSDERRQAMSQAAIQAGPWNNPKANALVWLMATDIYTLHKMYNTADVARIVGTTYSSLLTIGKKIVSGWNPNEDGQYLCWLEEYKQKELYEST